MPATVSNVSAPIVSSTSLPMPTSTMTSQPFTTTTSLPGTVLNHTGTYNNVVSQKPVTNAMPQAQNLRVMQIKQEEPQTVPCLNNSMTSLSPPMSPIDMESQERIKLERKRERNRVAARKCRTRKLERISRLEDRVSDLKLQNTNLTQTASALREQVFKLKQQIMEHVNSGCQVMLSPNLV